MPDTNQQEIWAERVGVALRARRLDLGLTLQDLSRLSGSTVASLSLIERGKSVNRH
jgi:transcriptional regulator with XRE-family HTH domain